MNFSTARSERITAIASTLVAIAILAGGVTAYQSHNAPVDDVVQLESDLRFQLEVAFRHDPNERARRLVKLEEVSQAWQQSSRTTAGHERLASWLLEATIRSMPGAIETLPAVPSFDETPAATAQLAETPDVLIESSVEEDAFEPTAQVPTPAHFASEELPQPILEATAPLVEPLPLPATVQVAMAPIQINLTELAARIAGYHAGLDEVERALLTLDAEDTLKLAAQIRQLDEMTRDYRFVRLYYGSLTEKERKAIDLPRTMADTLAEIERRIDRAQETLSGDFLGDFDSGNLNQIADLRQQLAGVTSRLDW